MRKNPARSFPHPDLFLLEDTSHPPRSRGLLPPLGRALGHLMDLELEQAAREVMWWKLVREAHFYGERSAPPDLASKEAAAEKRWLKAKHEARGAGMSFAEVNHLSERGFDTARTFFKHGIELPRANPLLVKRGKVASLGDTPVKEMSPTHPSLKENIVVLGPMGHIGEIFGYHPKTHILYFLIDPADKKAFVQRIVQEPLFYPNHRPSLGGEGTLDAFWKNRRTQKLASAIQFYVNEEGTLVVTHMQTKAAWRRQGLNALLIDHIKASFPHTKVIFDKPTDEGEAFMQARGYEGAFRRPPRGNPLRPELTVENYDQPVTLVCGDLEVLFHHEGAGGVPDVENVRYKGIMALMTPRTFLRLAPPLDPPSPTSRHALQQATTKEGFVSSGNEREPLHGWGAPYLVVDEDCTRIKGHEGRHRCTELVARGCGDEPIPVAIFVGNLRARHLGQEQLEKLRAGLIREKTNSARVPGPLFNVAFCNDVEYRWS